MAVSRIFFIDKAWNIPLAVKHQKKTQMIMCVIMKQNSNNAIPGLELSTNL